MAEFEVKVVKIDSIEDHPNADALELAVIGGYRAIVKLGEFKAGDPIVYIPEQAIVPQWLLAHMGLEGRLAGKDKNRVKAIKLRGILSQGLVLPVERNDEEYDGGVWSYFILPGEHQGYLIAEGDLNKEDVINKQLIGLDVAELFGITKYEPPIPVSMSGDVVSLYGHTLKYDIENVKKYPDAIWDGEEVVMTEKLHGTFCGIGFWPGLGKKDVFDGGEAFTFSKGLGAQGLVFKDTENNKNNLYVRNLVDLIDGVGINIFDGIRRAFEAGATKGYPRENLIKEFRKGKPMPVFILGEIFGKGIQDLSYGLDGDTFRVFDVYIGEPGKGRYLDFDELEKFCANYVDLAMVPILYRGPFDQKIADDLCNGKTAFEGHEGSCIREGVVIKPVDEREDVMLGRAIVKHVGEDYLTRRGGTEFN